MVDLTVLHWADEKVQRMVDSWAELMAPQLADLKAPQLADQIQLLQFVLEEVMQLLCLVYHWKLFLMMLMTLMVEQDYKL